MGQDRHDIGDLEHLFRFRIGVLSLHSGQERIIAGRPTAFTTACQPKVSRSLFVGDARVLLDFDHELPQLRDAIGDGEFPDHIPDPK